MQRTIPLVRGVAVAALSMLVVPACDDDPGPEFRDGELMFDLTDDELIAFHATYVPEDDPELTRARLTAPFDCALFDDFCDQVGRDGAIEVTRLQIELGRTHASTETMNEETAAWISDAMDAYDPEEVDEVFRGSGPWSTRTKGNERLRVRNGVTSPVAGDREAWTQSKFQRQTFGTWWQVQADTLCANTGTNTQDWDLAGSTTTIETKNPGEICHSNDGKMKHITLHNRNNGGPLETFTITADGCGSADNDGTHFGICADSTLAFY